MSHPTLTGACLCGTVRFEIDLPVKWCAHCHCSMCRRAHGAPFVTWAGVSEEAFRLTAGEEDLGRFRSSAEAQRSFCRRCGSPLLFTSTQWPGEVHVAVASLTEPHELRPRVDAYFDDRADWVTVSPELPHHGGEG